MSNRELVPVVELGHDNKAKDTIFVPANKLDSMIGELSSDYDFGLGQMEVSGAANYQHELGKLNVGIKAPKVKASVKVGHYKALKSSKKAPVHKAVKQLHAKGKKAVVLARHKASVAATMPVQPSLAKVYAKLDKAGKLISSMDLRRKLQAEHKRKLADDAFQGNVISMLKKIDQQVAGSGNKNYYQRWNQLKKATGVAVQHR